MPPKGKAKPKAKPKAKAKAVAKAVPKAKPKLRLRRPGVARAGGADGAAGLADVLAGMNGEGAQAGGLAAPDIIQDGGGHHGAPGVRLAQA
eukprot:659581-Amphidinium_carterae.1